MADKVHFLLDDAGRYRLSFDAWQWLIHAKRPNGDWELCAVGLRSRGEVFACLRHKDILITDEALHRIDTELMESFTDWQEARAGIRPFDPNYKARARREKGTPIAPSGKEAPAYLAGLIVPSEAPAGDQDGIAQSGSRAPRRPGAGRDLDREVAA